MILDAQEEGGRVLSETVVVCPTPTAHKRLEEIHHFWHKCLDGYQDPEEFRVNLNAAIQASRNLTFALQHEKKLIEDFDEWYAGWQGRMKKDVIFGWLNDARVQIVHRGDLETRSKAIAHLITNYDDAARVIHDDLSERPSAQAIASVIHDGSDTEAVIEAPPLYTLREIWELVEGCRIPPSIRQDATLAIERRWEDARLPGQELLNVIAYCFGFLRLMLDDAHDRANVHHELLAVVEGQVLPAYDVGAADGRLPCMITTRDVRTVNLRVRDGELEERGMLAVFRGQSSKDDPLLLQQRPPAQDLFDAIPSFVEIAKHILNSHPQHGWFVFAFRGMTPIQKFALAAADKADKRQVAQDLADFVAMNGVDGIIEIGEVWMAPLSLGFDGTPVPPAAHTGRLEAVVMHVKIASGESRHITIPFERTFVQGKKKKKSKQPRLKMQVKIHDVTEQDGKDFKNNFMAPVQAVWTAQGLRKRRVIPGSSFYRNR